MYNTSLKNIKSFAVYYGISSKEDFKSCDLLILEPAAHNDESIREKKGQGITLAAYLSVVEVRPEDELFNTLDHDDFLCIDGVPVQNKEYNTFYMDITKDKVQKALIKRANMLFSKGFDGVFLDTLGNLDYLDGDTGRREEMMEAAAKIISKMRIANPHGFFIQNNGILGLCDYTIGLIDGICFENPPFCTVQNMIWTVSAFKKLAGMAKDNKIKILILQEKTDKYSPVKSKILQGMSRSYGFLYYLSPRYYQ